MPTPKVALVVISDRGDLYLPRCLDRLNEIGFPFVQQIVLEDPSHDFGQNEVVGEAWGRVHDDVEYIAHVEEDFLVHEFEILDMVRILEENPDLANLVLKRQPWNGEELAAGGIIECFPDSYEDCVGFVRHRRFFSLNPCIVPRKVFEKGWAGSEGDMTDRCIAEGLLFAFYGKRFDPPRCTHIGEVRGCS